MKKQKSNAFWGVVFRSLYKTPFAKQRWSKVRLIQGGLICQRIIYMTALSFLPDESEELHKRCCFLILSDLIRNGYILFSTTATCTATRASMSINRKIRGGSIRIRLKSSSIVDGRAKSTFQDSDWTNYGVEILQMTGFQGASSMD